MDKLNRIKKILSAELGTKIPLLRPSWANTDYTFAKSNGTLNIYSKDGKDWYKDLLNNPTAYYGSLDGFSDINSPTSTNTFTNIYIPGANPVEGNPNAVLETAANDNQAVLDGVKKVLIDQQVKLLVIEPSKLEPKIEIKGLNTSPDALKEASKGMNQISELDKEEAAKKAKKELAIANAGAVAGAAFKGIGAAFGAQQAATDSNLTKTADTIYDGVTEQVKKMGPVGQIVGEALGNAAIAGDIIQGLGGGTDQMTTTDKWMNSSFFSWNIGMINGFGGKKADTFAADQDVLESVGSSYGGTSAEIMDAASKSGKKYGVFSSSARRRANRAMAAARAKQNIMADISDEATDQRLAILSMGELAGLAYSMMTDGGYNQKYTYAAKHGGTLEWNPEITLEWEPQIELNWELPTFKEGGQILEELEWVPEFQEGGKTRTLEELIAYAKEKNPRFIQRLSESPHGIEFIDDEGNKGVGNVFLEWATADGNAVIYPRILEMDDKSLKFLSKDEAWERADKNNNILIMSPEEAQIFFAEDPEYLTAYKRGWPEMFKNYSEKVELKEEYPQEYIDFKNSLPDNLKNTPESEYRTYLYWQLWNKPKDFQYTLEHPNEDGDYMYNWDSSDKSYHGSSIAWGKDGVGYFIKPKHHPTLKYELDYYNQGIITQEGGGQRKPFTSERKKWEDFRKNYTLEEDGNFYKYVPIKQSESFKTGGTIKDSLKIPEIEETTQKNVIPEGALHKNKHHMEHAEGLTKKGIPVIDEEGELQAEIELNEIIFTLEVTKKLEEYYEIFYSEDSTNKEKEQAALEAGKLLVYEILENTDDRTGLIESCKKGGSITLKKSTDDLIEETLEWIPAITIIEEVIEEVKEEKPKKKSEKELMKEAIKEVLIELLTK